MKRFTARILGLLAAFLLIVFAVANRHLVTVSRIIGAKPGTGGTEGVPYLRRVLETRLFPELWQARTEL